MSSMNVVITGQGVTTKVVPLPAPRPDPTSLEACRSALAKTRTQGASGDAFTTTPLELTAPERAIVYYALQQLEPTLRRLEILRGF